MIARLGDIRFRIGLGPVTVEVKTPFGTTTLQMSQPALQARAGETPWTDEHVIALAQDTLNTLYPTSGFVVEAT